MNEQAHQVLVTGVDAEELTIHHVGNQGQRRVEVERGDRECMHQPLPGKARLDQRVARERKPGRHSPQSRNRANKSRRPP